MTPDERLARALGPCTVTTPDGVVQFSATTISTSILAADPDLAADIEVGRLLREVEAALPRERPMLEIQRYPISQRWAAWSDKWEHLGEGTTLPEALRALLDALRAR